MAANEHQISTVSSFTDGGLWHGECSCGWKGEPHHKHDDAMKDAENHRLSALGWKP